MESPSPIAALLDRYRSGISTPLTELDACLARANSNAGHNVYVTQDPEWSRAEARALRPAARDEQPLWGVPVSLKDCFDLAGFPTSCGSRYFLDHEGQPAQIAADSAVAQRLRSTGAVIVGKTHMHQIAYGITGESADFGDCLQPADATRLTGGSSSGAAASVQEGSALAAIGTDTGGSVRVPAALCGLAGYRSSMSLNTSPACDIWRGGAHLAPSFDTVGWLYRDLRDGPRLAAALFDLPLAEAAPPGSLRIGVPDPGFLHDCEPAVLDALAHWSTALAAHGAAITPFDAALWADALEIMVPIQAREAAVLHLALLDHLEPAIAQRIAWGQTITAAELALHHQRLAQFRQETLALFQSFDYLLLPCAPMAALTAGSDQAQARPRILRYTAPMSLCGLPVVALPSAGGAGLQLVGRLNSDAGLLALGAALAPLQP